jgi:hypothetical protein
MLDDFTSLLQFLLLDLSGVSLHTINGEGFGESVGNEGVGMETRECDELPSVRRNRICSAVQTEE